MANNTFPFLYIGADSKNRIPICEYSSSSRSLRKDIREQGIEKFGKYILWQGTIDDLRTMGFNNIFGLEEVFHVSFGVVRDHRFYNKVKANTNFTGQGRAVYIYNDDPHNKTIVLPNNHPDVLSGAVRGFQSGRQYSRTEEQVNRLRKPKSKEHRRKIKEAHLGKPKIKLRKPKSEEHKQNMRKPKSEEHRQKLTKVNQNRMNRSVFQIDQKTDEVICKFESIQQAAIAIGNIKFRSSISDCCRGKQKTAYGYVWKYSP